MNRTLARHLRAALLLGVLGLHSACAAWTDAPYWEIEYALEGSTLEIRGTPMKNGDGIFAVGPGRLTLQVEAGLEEGARARLAGLEMLQRFEVREIATDLRLELRGEALGHFDGSSRVIWSTPATELHTTGTIRCEMAANFCDVASLLKGSNVIDRLVDEELGDARFDILNRQPYDMAMDWVLSPDPSGSTKTLHLRAVETRRTLRGG